MTPVVLDVDRLLTELTLAEKASLTSGSSFWYTAPVERLGIPKIMVSDGPHALLRRIGQALDQEARACNLLVILGPGINIKRSPLCGRNFEYFSEDPFLAGELAVGIVGGIQSRGVGTSVKHYAANNQETDRLRVDAQVDERTLREIYLPAFERVVTAEQPWTVMCSYNKVNGVSASENPWLLTTVLREEFGFEGLVVSDWGAVYHRVPALLAGLDLEMPPALGRTSTPTTPWPARRLPGRSCCSRTRGCCRWPPTPGSRSSGSSPAPPLPGRRVLPGDPDPGRRPARRTVRRPRRGGFRGRLRHRPDRDDEALRAEAEQVAGSADTVVMVIGLPGADESEGFDRTHLFLPANQLAALAAVAAVNPNVVVVLVNGSTVVLGDVIPHAKAVIEAWLGGQAAGGAIADVLTGAVNPSGRLAETVPHRLEDNSSCLNFPGDSQIVRYGERIFVGYRGYDRAHQNVAFPFGFGPSYTTFALSDLEVTTRGSVAEGTLGADIRVTVTNTGTLDGADVVQVYVRDVASTVARPVRELKGFTKVRLNCRPIPHGDDPPRPARLRVLVRRHGRWAVEAGEFVVAVGHDSRDLPLTATISVEAPTLAEPLSRDSTLQEWMNDTIGRQLIEREIAQGQSAAVLNDDLVEVIGNFPMSTLASFGGMSLDHDAVDRVSEEWPARSKAGT